MSRRILIVATACLAVAGAAHAQWGGGGMGGGGGRHGGGHRQQQAPPASSGPAGDPAPVPRETPLSKVTIVGVVEKIDPPSDRITIKYEPVDALNWPAGTMPFVVARPQLLDQARVGEKIRFRIESQQITELEPFTPGPPAP
jgi:Cu(I)/Ag(I) efflux system protein CusF